MADPWIEDEDELNEPADDAGFFMPDEDEQAERAAAMAQADPEMLTEEESALIASWDEGPEHDPLDFAANLAESLPESYSSRLAQRVVQWVDEDKQARRDWEIREAEGIRLLGVADDPEGGAQFEGASRVVHPLLSIGVLQFQARAIAELWPAGGPAKTIVLGESSEDLEAQAKRVKDFLNFQYTQLMPGAFHEVDRMFMRLPVSGSCFKRVYWDPIDQTVVSRMIEGSQVYAPYKATDLVTVPRFTYEFAETTVETRRKQIDGYYLDVDLLRPTESVSAASEVRSAIDAADGLRPVALAEDEDTSYTRYECACFLDLPGFEDEVPLPYLVTVDADSQRVLRVARNWSPTDARKRRRVHLIHYRFTPGFGFYGFGLVHLVGNLSLAATGSLRALLDAAFLANTPGGFVTRDARLGAGKLKQVAGHWYEAQVDAETLAKAFHPFKYEEPSPTLVALLKQLEDLANSVMTTTENMVGESNNNAPVGTTLALIEQGLKVFSGVHKRLHEAQTQELKLVAELNAEYLPPQYPYLVEGAEQSVFATDFDDRVDVVPVSDPNIVTNTQRIAQAQSVRQLAMESPDLYDRKKVERMLLETLRIAQIDEILPDRSQIPRADPVSEGVAMMTGQPASVFPDQDHMAHIAVHQAARAGLPTQLANSVGTVIDAHIAEHYAQLYKAQMALQMGVTLPNPGEDVDPQIEAQLAQAAAMVPQVVMPDRPLVSSPGDDARAMQAEADIARKDRIVEADIARKDKAATWQQNQQESQLANDLAQSLIQEAQAKRGLMSGTYGAQVGGGLSDPVGLAAL